MKQKNKIHIITFIIVASTIFFGCKKKLDLVPQTSITDANFWKSSNDLMLATNYLYSFLPGLGNDGPTGSPTPTQDLYSNDAFGNSSNSISDGTRLAPANSGEWTGYYKLVRAANNIIENSVKVNGTLSDINKYVGEAKFFRAFAYFELVKRFGDVPYIDKTISIGDPLLFSSRTSRQLVLEKVYGDLDSAYNNLPSSNSQSLGEYGRITANAALAMKSRVALFEGTFDKYHGDAANATKHLTIAVTASSALMNLGQNGLFGVSAAVNTDIGNTTILSQTDNGNSTCLHTNKITLTQALTINSLSIYCTNAGGNVVMAIYDNDNLNNKPNTLKARTAIFTPVAGQWNTQQVLSQVSLAPGTYWIAFQPSSDAFTTGFDRSGTSYSYCSSTFGTVNGVFPNGYSQTYKWNMYGNFSSSSSGGNMYYKLFQNDGEGKANKENILVRIYGVDPNNSISTHNFTRSILENGFLNATKSIVDAYLFIDGLPVGVSPFDSTSQQTSTLTEFRNRDPRMGMSFWQTGDTYLPQGSMPVYVPTLKHKIKKYWIDADWSAGKSYIDFQIIRYAEILLNYAEAKFELTGSISDADLNLSINLIRGRVNMPSLTNAFVNANGLNMKMEIRRERRVELAFEGFHYWDLLRWKTAETELPLTILGAKYFPNEMPGGAGNLNPDGFAILQNASQRTFLPNRDYLWPLPTREIGLNANLAQNPGGW